MATKTINNVQLGIFIISGLLVLVIGLYLIGKKQNAFGARFVLKAQFETVSGLKRGNNVRYAGIEIGTVKDIYVVNDSLVEVVMVVQEEMQKSIKQNAIASVGSDGLMGNKVVNIIAGRGNAPIVQNGGMLSTQPGVTIDEMLQVFSSAAGDITEIASNLKVTTRRLNESTAFWTLMNDETLPVNVRTSLANASAATEKANQFIGGLNAMLTDIRNGKGSLGTILTDTMLVHELERTVKKVRITGEQAETIARDVSRIVKNVDYEINEGDGLLNAALKDTVLVGKLSRTMDNMERATTELNHILEALKRNFLFRGYFRKLEQQNQEAKQ